METRNAKDRESRKQQKKESEKLIERKLKGKVEALGGWCLKLSALHISGLPDRLCLIPFGIIFFAETKSTRDKPSKLQALIHRRLNKMGFNVFVIDSSIKIDKAINEMVNYN